SAIPGIVSWDLGISGPFGQISSVRGSSSFTSNYLKTYVDGVELASPYLLFAIDPYSIERIEVIRGPQGSALYGSDAISGVVQIITRKGSPSAKWKPQADVALSAGRMESRFTEGANSTQRHSAMLFTGGGSTSLGVGGTYESVGAVVPGSESGYRGTYGGFRTMLGPVRIDASTRYADIRFTSSTNPLLRNTDLSLASYQPLIEPQRIENETYGLTADWQPNERWRQTLVLGLDRHAGSIPPQREPAAVADALLGATRENVSKSSIRYSMTGRLFAVPGAKLTATAGAERSALARERLGNSSSVIGVGEGLTALYSDDVRNTGIFGQLKLDVANALFVTAGLRGERNTSFGENYGTAYAPMVGMAWTRELGAGTTLKLRTAYGKGIRPPPPIARRTIQTAGYRQLANPDLKPEVQSGTEGGVELYAGDRATLSLTAYTQSADGLVQQVLPPGRDIRTIQYQNVGRIQNRGIEVEGNARVGALRGDLNFAFTDSRVRALSATYTGELEIGDRVPEVPRTSGTASVTYEAWRLRATLGSSYIGSWIGYDWLAFYNADAGVAPAETSLRGYWRIYPSLTKPFIGVTYALRHGAEWYVRVDNLTNLQRFERDDLLITQGRTARVGLRLQR
ncbi:MAG: TonB-dependent receptor, partial [Gemmatimonadaceae bacterium]